MNYKNVLGKFGFQDYKILEKTKGRLDAGIYKLKNNNSKIVFLKTGKGIVAESLSREKEVLTWLKNKKVTVPEVLGYHESKNNGIAFLFLSALEGTAAQRVTSLDKNAIVKIVAEGLKTFHLISKNGSKKLRTLDDDLDFIKSCLEHNLIKSEDFKKENEGKTPKEVCSHLMRHRNKFSSNIVVHGDYCLPNIIINDNKFGFLDLADCGLGDPYRDFSAIEGSISRNFGGKWVDIFFKYYGIKKVDKFKIEYFKLIDQFSYHLDIYKYSKQIMKPGKF